MARKQDAELARVALAKAQRGETPTRREEAALERVRAEQAAQQRQAAYAAVPLSDWATWAGCTPAVAVRRARAAGLPAAPRRPLELPAVVSALYAKVLPIVEQRYVLGTREQVAEWFGVSIQAVNKWSENGMPGRRGRYDLEQIARWRTARLAKLRVRGRANDYERHKAERLRWQARRERNTVRQQELALYARADVQQFVAGTIAATIAALERVPTELVDTLERVPRDERRERAEDWVAQVRDELATTALAQLPRAVQAAAESEDGHATDAVEFGDADRAGSGQGGAGGKPRTKANRAGLQRSARRQSETQGIAGG